MTQPAASSALSSAKELANVPVVILLHTGTAKADLTTVGWVWAETAVFSVKRFFRASRAEHWAPASLANRTMHATQSTAITLTRPCLRVGECGMARRALSSLAVRY